MEIVNLKNELLTVDISQSLTFNGLILESSPKIKDVRYFLQFSLIQRKRFIDYSKTPTT